MDLHLLEQLSEAYRGAPAQFRATRYWESYESRILDDLRRLDVSKIRSGAYPVLATFGFGDVVHYYHPNSNPLRRLASRIVRELLVDRFRVLPYGVSLDNLRQVAFRHCELAGELAGLPSIRTIEVSTFGEPRDLFQMGGKAYSMNFLTSYLRLCFAHRSVNFAGDEVVVELGPGAGTQVEVIKKTFPDVTVFCFDLPAQIYLCHAYLSQVLGQAVVPLEETMNWTSLEEQRRGGVHFFGNWQIDLTTHGEYDVFWSAASFGEMEPHIVSTYLSRVRGRAQWVYLLQARHGKEVRGRTSVETPMRRTDYDGMLAGYTCVSEGAAWTPLGELSDSGEYFQGVWRNEAASKIRSTQHV